MFLGDNKGIEYLASMIKITLSHSLSADYTQKDMF